ncbi:hypothetical protein BKA61DRAFT_742489 [Leptodontidium sp. MPI-SDFR-AT-0119]|nr:hypothetical protein BKA61DRAFT_742489 [Leptodontidium sp. MPI-SDFR-AT-0119]
MTSSPGPMELSDPPEALSDPFGSFPLSDPTIILGDTEVEASSPTLPYSNTGNSTTIQNVAPLSSDHLEMPLSSANFSAAPPRPTRPIRKRGPGPLPNRDHTNKALRLSQETNKSPTDLILNARDLIIQAYTLTKAREEQSKLLDLLEIFREYTEKGKLQLASSIIASQIANLETATRQIENKTKALTKSPPPTTDLQSRTNTTTSTGSATPSFASVVTQGATRSSSPQD